MGRPGTLKACKGGARDGLLITGVFRDAERQPAFFAPRYDKPASIVPGECARGTARSSAAAATFTVWRSGWKRRDLQSFRDMAYLISLK